MDKLQHINLLIYWLTIVVNIMISIVVIIITLRPSPLILKAKKKKIWQHTQKVT